MVVNSDSSSEEEEEDEDEKENSGEEDEDYEEEDEDSGESNEEEGSEDDMDTGLSLQDDEDIALRLLQSWCTLFREILYYVLLFIFTKNKLKGHGNIFFYD